MEKKEKMPIKAERQALCFYVEGHTKPLLILDGDSNKVDSPVFNEVHDRWKQGKNTGRRY